MVRVQAIIVRIVRDRAVQTIAPETAMAIKAVRNNPETITTVRAMAANMIVRLIPAAITIAPVGVPIIVPGEE